MKIISPVTINDARLISSNVNESDYLPYSVVNTYGIGDRARVVTADSHLVYESIQGANTGHIPNGSSTDLWWILYGRTNKWEMFDSSLTTQTSYPNLIDITIRPASRIDSLALFNLSAGSLNITISDPIEGIVYNKTTSLIDSSNIQNWYSYLLEPIVRNDSFCTTDLPPYSTADIRLTLSDTGQSVGCGACVIGIATEIGNTQYGAKAGIQDYSIKTKDTFGNYSITERAFNKYADLTISIENTKVDIVEALLTKFRATPIVYVGSDAYESLLIYGFYDDFSVVISQPSVSICSLSIKGLT